MENIVFYFSGTGNSLSAAKTLAEKLGNCRIVSMTRLEKNILDKAYNSIGFVYPTYCWGLPKIVRKFIENIKIKNNKTTYFYSIATYGGIIGNGISQIKELLKDKQKIELNYGTKLKMVANCIIVYNIAENITKILNRSEKKLEQIIIDIKERKHNNVKKSNKIFNKLYQKSITDIPSKDYNVNENCSNCGTCVRLCPVKNIEIIDGKHQFKNYCEQCLSCIHYCPQKAINYKNVTQKRRRYNNPEINYEELIKFNKEGKFEENPV